MAADKVAMAKAGKEDMRLLSILMLVLLGVALWLALTVRKVLFILSGGCL